MKTTFRGTFVTVASAAFAALILGGLTAATGCNKKSSDKAVGTIDMSLSLPDGTTIDSAHYKITHSNGYLNEGDVPVQDSTTVAFQIGKIPEGTGYEVTLSATTSAGLACSAGPVSFDTMADATTLITMTLKCGGDTASKSGNLRVNADVQSGGCPRIDGVTAVPLEVIVGKNISLQGRATTSGATFLWSVAPTSGGTFSSASSDNTTFTCAEEGSHTVTLTVQGGEGCTASTATVPITCSRGGTGGAGEGGAGTGGEAGAGAGGEAGAGAGGEGGAGTGGEGGAGTGGTGGAGANCAACRDEHCRNYQGSGLDVVKGCFEVVNADLGAPAGDPTFIQQCTDAVNCAFAKNCAYGQPGPQSCYCGTATADECVQVGPKADAQCKAEFQAAARSLVNDDVVSRFVDFAYPLGWANFLLTCDRDSCNDASGDGKCTP